MTSRYAMVIWILIGCVLTAVRPAAVPASATEWVVPYDPLTMNYRLTPDQAAERARAWFGDPALPLTLAGVYRAPVRPWLDWYQFFSGNLEFDVNCDEGWIHHWRDGEAAGRSQALRAEEVDGNPPRLSTEQLNEIGLNFMRSHELGWDQMGMHPTATSGMKDRSVKFVHKTPSGVMYSSFNCSVWLNPFSGEIISYRSQRNPLPTIGLQPSLGEAEIVNRAFALVPQIHPEARTAYLHPLEDPRAVIPEVALDDLRQQLLVYGVALIWSENVNHTYEEAVASGRLMLLALDAHTGAYILHEDFLGAPAAGSGQRQPGKRFPSSRRSPGPPPAAATIRRDDRSLRVALAPIAGEDTTYWYAGYLRNAYWRGEVSREGAELRLRVNDREARLTDGERMAVIDGKRTKLSGAPFQKKGRSYIPIEVFAQLTGESFTWRANLLDIRSRPLQAAGAPSKGIYARGHAPVEVR